VKKLVVLGAGAIAVASAALLHPAVALSDPTSASVNVVGEPYAKALSILKSQNVRTTFGGSFGSDVPQSACIVDKQKVATGGKMILMLNCTTKAVQDATASTPQQGAAPAAGGAPGAPTPGTPGQGTYGGPIGVPVPVG
jgi:hypothetical protein